MEELLVRPLFRQTNLLVQCCCQFCDRAFGVHAKKKSKVFFGFECYLILEHSLEAKIDPQQPI